MTIVVLTKNDTRSRILIAGIELSGYHHRVVAISVSDATVDLIHQQTPQLIIFDQPALSDDETVYRNIQAEFDIPILTIGENIFSTVGHVPFPYQFTQLFDELYKLAPPNDFIKEKQLHFVSQQDEEVKYQDLFNRASDAIFLVDLETHIIIDVNKRVTEIYGYEFDELIGMSLLQIVPEEEHPRMLVNTRKMRDERTVLSVSNRTHIKKDGTLISVSLSASLIEYGGRSIFQDIVRDETDRIQQENELKRLNQIKDEFVSNISHELRTPLTSLNMRIHLLKNSPQALDRHLSVFQREVDRLDGLIDNLLILSRLDQRREAFIMTTFDINHLVEEYYEDRQPIAESAGLVMHYSTLTTPALVNGSYDLLGQVLSIFLTNAINYTPADGQITLSTLSRESENQQWVGFSVRDTGNGISPDEQQSLFTRFFRGKVGQRSEKSGTGLGLSIAKEIIDFHDGQITVESTGIPGEGATFTAWLTLFE